MSALRGGFVRLAVVATLAAFSATTVTAWEVPASKLDRAPGPAELTEIGQLAAKEGWPAVGDAASRAAVAAYQLEKNDPAYAWLLVARWAELFGRSERDFVTGWIDSINEARLGHSNMPRGYNGHDGPLDQHVPPEFSAWVLSHPRFSESFFGLLTEYDFLPSVLKTLAALHAENARTFETYAELALAVAVVYDVPPPPGWPHAQVSQRLLPRKLPEPSVVFSFFVDLDRSGRSLHRLAYLTAKDLKFLVDVAAPLDELYWAQTSITTPLAELASTYEAVKYRSDRVNYGVYNWPGKNYSLAGILEEGGICVDQAYFASEAGKARGVPTLVFRGSGLDGRHAWFGYLDGMKHWQLDAGRFAEQRFVTGLAHDPQTWGNLSDHEIQFLSEGFRTTPSYRQAQIHADFAARFLQEGNTPAAIKAARKAISTEMRHLDAWETLVAAQKASNAEPKGVEVTLRDAGIAFQRYADLNARFVRAQAESLRARGETSAADYAERMFARKHQTERTDLTISQATAELGRATLTQPLFEQMRIYRSIVDQFGRGAGIEFFDKVVKPFVGRLVSQGKSTEALQALEQARAALSPQAGSQLDRDLTAMAEQVRG